MDLGSLLQSYQTLIGAVVGLSGVAATLYFNARREERAREATQRRQARATMVALAAELDAIAESLEHSKTSRHASEVRYLIPLKLDHVFSANADKLGVLPEGVLKPVIEAHVTFRQIPFRLRNRLSGKANLVMEADAGSAIVTVSPRGDSRSLGEVAKLLDSVFTEILKTVNEARETLDRFLKMR